MALSRVSKSTCELSQIFRLNALSKLDSHARADNQSGQRGLYSHNISKVGLI